MSDYRIEAASKEEWAERALRAETENERLRCVLQSVRGAILSGRRVDALTILGHEFRY